MRRTILLLALLATAAAAAKNAPEPRQFLDKSVITLPNSVGEYALAETHYDPERWVYGVTSKWAVNAAPDGLRLTVFVYPLGRTSEEHAVAQQIAEVEASMHEAVKQGVYTDLAVSERKPFVVVARAPSILEEGNSEQQKENRDTKTDDRSDLLPKPELGVEASDDSDPLAATLAASLPSPNSHGLRQAFRFTHDGVPVRSLGYVFYRHLFAFKVRITAPADSMDDTTFEALADTATRNLVPHIDVRNFGQCGNIALAEPNSNADEEAASNAMAQQLLLGIARLRTDNCAAAEGEKSADEPSDGTRIEIVYPADSWRPVD